MAMRDLAAATITAPVLHATMNADNTPAALDRRALRLPNDCLILIQVGIGGITFNDTNKIEFKITHSDDDTTYTAVTSTDVVLGANADTAVGTGGIVKSLVSAHASPSVTEVSYIGGKRYLKVLADFSGTHGTGTPICVTLLGTRDSVKP